MAVMAVMAVTAVTAALAASTAPVGRRQAALRRGLAALGATLLLGVSATATAMQAIDVERELKLLAQGVQPPPRLGEQAFRVAVFAHEDPDGSALDDALATLESHELLTRSFVSSLGVLRYVGRLTPAGDDPLGYFDKVDRLTAAQRPDASLWGMLRRGDDGVVVVETYLQLSTALLDRGLQARLALPQAMGGGVLRGQLGSDRLLLQRLRLSPADAAAVRRAAARLGEWRAAPDDAAAVVARPSAQTLSVALESRGGWVRLRSADGRSGWVPAGAPCDGACAALLQPPRFVAGLLGFVERRRPFDIGASLAADAHQLHDHAMAIGELDAGARAAAGGAALERLTRWQARAGDTAAYAQAAGAASANLRLLARLTTALRDLRDAGGGTAYDALRLPTALLRDAAHEAAEAAVVDPGNVDLLHNLRLLYGLVGDARRAALAASLLEQAAATRRR